MKNLLALCGLLGVFAIVLGLTQGSNPTPKKGVIKVTPNIAKEAAARGHELASFAAG